MPSCKVLVSVPLNRTVSSETIPRLTRDQAESTLYNPLESSAPTTHPRAATHRSMAHALPTPSPPPPKPPLPLRQQNISACQLSHAAAAIFASWPARSRLARPSLKVAYSAQLAVSRLLSTRCRALVRSVPLPPLRPLPRYVPVMHVVHTLVVHLSVFRSYPLHQLHPHAPHILTPPLHLHICLVYQPHVLHSVPDAPLHHPSVYWNRMIPTLCQVYQTVCPHPLKRYHIVQTALFQVVCMRYVHVRQSHDHDEHRVPIRSFRLYVILQRRMNKRRKRRSRRWKRERKKYVDGHLSAGRCIVLQDLMNYSGSFRSDDIEAPMCPCYMVRVAE